MEDFVSSYEAEPVRESRLYHGIRECLETLGTELALLVLSNKDHRITELVVRHLLPGISFALIRGAGPDFPHKPDPAGLLDGLARIEVEPSEALYLGDSDVDMETSRRAGTYACGALWGFRTKAELVNAGAQEVFETPRAFQDWVWTRLSKA